MQITELLKLTEWFKLNIVEAEIPARYTNLFNKMNQNVIGRYDSYTGRYDSYQKQPFETEKQSLFEVLESTTFNSLTLEQIRFLEQLKVKELLGINGVKIIEDILYKNNLDIATATQKIGEFTKIITDAQNILQELETVLKKSFSIDKENEIPDDSIMMRVYFQGGSSINNLADLKELGASWHEIGRGIAMAQNKSPEDFKIIGAQKGSLIIEMAVVVGLVTSVSTIIRAGLEVAEKVIEISKKAEELKAMKLRNENIERELKKEVDEVEKDGIQSILNTTVEQLGLNKEQEGDKINALEKSIIKLIDFTKKGGAVDIIQPDDDKKYGDDIREKFLKLNEDIKEIRRLENKIKMLESRIDNKNRDQQKLYIKRVMC